MRHRLAITGIFFLNGAMFSAWYARLPAIQADLALSPGQVGIALLGAPVGLLLAQPAIGALVTRRGSRSLVAATPVYVLAIALPALAVDLPTLVLAVFAVGAANGALDIAMNANGLSVERRAGRRLFSSLHAAFSFGALAGAAAAGAFAAVGVEPLAHLLAWSGAGAIAALALVPQLLTDVPSPRPPAGTRRLARPSRRLLVLSAIAFCVLLAEGAVFDWSGIFLARDAGASEGAAATRLGALLADDGHRPTWRRRGERERRCPRTRARRRRGCSDRPGARGGRLDRAGRTCRIRSHGHRPIGRVPADAACRRARHGAGPGCRIGHRIHGLPRRATR